MRRRTLLAVAVLVPAALAAQSQAPQSPADGVMLSFEHYADLYGSRLVAAFDSIPAARYDYRPTPTQQTIGYIAQHVADGNYSLCDRFGDLKHTATPNDSVADVVKARWPKDTLVARLRASLRFCDAAIERAGVLKSSDVASTLLGFETDLAEHYSQLSGYMRLLGMVPPSALPIGKRVAIELPASALLPYVGLYQLVPGTDLDVTIEDGALFIRSTPGGRTVHLYAESKIAFFVTDGVDAQITFTRDASGTVAGLVLHQNGRDLPATKVR
jgi:hypothetical protein